MKKESDPYEEGMNYWERVEMPVPGRDDEIQDERNPKMNCATSNQRTIRKLRFFNGFLIGAILAYIFIRLLG